MGDGRRDLGSADLRAALRLYLVAGGLVVLLVLVLAASFGSIANFDFSGQQ